MPSAEAAPKKKHVRFAKMEEGIDHDEQEEDTLFDKRKDVKKGLKSALKRGKGALNLGTDQVDVIGNTGACRRWLVSLALCASFLGLVGLCMFGLIVVTCKAEYLQMKTKNLCFAALKSYPLLFNLCRYCSVSVSKRENRC